MTQTRLPLKSLPWRTRQTSHASWPLRVIQEILGHAEMSTTAIYTRASIKRLKQVHEQTHPAAHIKPTKTAASPALPSAAGDLLATLEAEAVEDDDS